jgi:DNA polymerase III delta prime subunit
VIEASTQKDRGIAVVEEYRRFCDFPAMGVPFKICVIIEADGLTSQAQKAFKELLSNPLYTKTVRCIIQTNYPNKLLPEIRNRCEMMTFKRVHDNELLKWLITTIIPSLFNLKLINNETKEKLLSNKADWLIKIVKASDGIPRSVLKKLQTFVMSGVITSTDEEYTLNPYDMISLSLKGRISEATRIGDKLIYSDAVNVYALLNDLRKIVLKEDIKDLRNVYKGELLEYLEVLQRDIFSGVSDEMLLAGLIGKCVQIGYKNSIHED